MPKVRLYFDGGTLILEGLNPSEIRCLFHHGPWQKDDRISAWRCEAMHYPEVRAILRENLGKAFIDEVPDPALLCRRSSELPALGPDPNRALTAWKASGCRGVVIIPPGDRRIDLALAAMAISNRATLIIVSAQEHLCLWHQRVRHAFILDGAAAEEDLAGISSATITTFQSAYLCMGDLGAGFGLIIFDEACRLLSRCCREIALLSTAPHRLGLTSALEPWTGLPRGLGRLVGPLVFPKEVPSSAGPSQKARPVKRIPVTLSRDERLRQDRANAVIQGFMAARKREKPDYSWVDFISDPVRDPEARKAKRALRLKNTIEELGCKKLEALEKIFQRHTGERVMVFTNSEAMAVKVSRRFLVPALLSSTRTEERLALLKGFTEGRLLVLVVHRMLDLGAPAPKVDVSVLLGSSRAQSRKTGAARILSGSAMVYEVYDRDPGPRAQPASEKPC